jgi:hypothetical protein
MAGTLKIIAGTFLLLFAGMWIYVGWRLYDFDPTDEKPKLVFSPEFASVAGFVAAAVAAGTAAVLGIEIQKGRNGGGGGAETLANAVKTSALLQFGILLYFAVGLGILLVWLSDTEIAPEMVASFAWGALGWMAGAFTAVFQSTGGGGARSS